MSDDLELLRQYASEGSEEAFAELTRAHLPLVYSAALRQTRSPQLAEEVAQSVFLDLARQGARLKRDTILPAWLYSVANRTAIDVVRRESRRQARERLAQDFTAMTTEDSQWKQIEPMLDEAMTALEEADRAAVLLRYFQGKSFREVGAALGASEDAAQKRVSRAIDRLREFFSRRGVAVGAVALAGAISAHSTQAVPASLAAGIVSAASTVGKAAGTTVLTTTKAIAMTTLQKALIAAAVVAAAGAGIYEAAQARRLGQEAEAMRRAQGPMAAQIESLRRARDEASNSLLTLRRQNEQLQRDHDDLARLRAEVGRLRQQTNDMALGAAGAGNDPELMAAALWKDRMRRLKKRLADNPSASIPELQLLNENDWLNAAKDDLNTDDDYRRGLAELRREAESKFLNMMQPALQKYMAAHNQEFPADLSQLQDYFDTPVDPAMLDRYTLKPSSQVPHMSMGSDEIVVEKAPVDSYYDTPWGMGPNGMGNTGTYGESADGQTLAPAFAAYQADHQSSTTPDLSQIQPYLTTPEQVAAFQRLTQRLKGRN